MLSHKQEFSNHLNVEKNNVSHLHFSWFVFCTPPSSLRRQTLVRKNHLNQYIYCVYKITDTKLKMLLSILAVTWIINKFWNSKLGIFTIGLDTCVFY